MRKPKIKSIRTKILTQEQTLYDLRFLFIVSYTANIMLTNYFSLLSGIFLNKSKQKKKIKEENFHVNPKFRPGMKCVPSN